MSQELSFETEEYVYKIYKLYQRRGINTLEDLRRVVNDRGTYFNGDILQLSDEEIAALRYIWRDTKGEYIAKKRILSAELNRKYFLETRKVDSIDDMELPRRRTTSNAKKKKFVVSREQKYNNSRHRIGKRPNHNHGKVGLIIGGVVVVFIAGSIFYSALTSQEPEIIVTDPNPIIVEVPTTNPDIGHDYADHKEVEGYDVVDSQEVLGEREQTISNLCNIYQVNYDIVYRRLCELTNDFTSDSYCNGIIEGVSCKGVPVVATSEEQLLVYAIRNIKQLPGDLGVSKENLYVDNGYDSGTDYFRQIDMVSSILGVDRCLMYAIVQAETEFKSELFNNSNNPAGIKIDGDWWEFDSKEEGFFELGMELLKYYRKIGISPDVVNKDVIIKISEIHAPLSDEDDVYGLNENWVGNVLDSLEYARLNEATLFGSEEYNVRHSY